jgi:hypothetical protein
MTREMEMDIKAMEEVAIKEEEVLEEDMVEEVEDVVGVDFIASTVGKKTILSPTIPLKTKPT